MTVTDGRKLAALVLAGIALRVVVAVASEPWTDEIFFAVTARGVPAELWTYVVALPDLLAGRVDASTILESTPRLAGEAHPPLTLLASALLRIPPDAPAWLLRLPALGFSVATLVLALWWARRRMGTAGAVATALLFGLSLPLVYHGTEVRPYAAAICFGLATTLLAIGPVRGGRWRARLYVLYGIVCALGLYSHYYVGGLFPAQLVGALLACRGDPARRRHAVGIFLGLAMAGLLFLPWAPVPLAKARMFAAAEDAAGPGAAALLVGVAATTGGAAPGWPLWARAIAAVITLALTTCGLWRWARTQPAVAWQLALAPLGLAALVVVAPHVHVFQAKHLAPAAGPLLLAGAGLWTGGSPGRAARTALLGLVALQGVALVSGLTRPREPWVAAGTVATSQLAPGDVVVFHPAHAKLGLHRQLARAGHRLYPADDVLRARPDWALPPLGVPNFRDTPEEGFWLYDSAQLAQSPRAFHVWLFGPHAVPVPPELPPEALRGREGQIYLEIGPVRR